MKTKRAGLITKVVILALLIGLSVHLLDLRAQLLSSQQEKQALTDRVQAQTQINADLANAVENSDDPTLQQDIAREDLGLVVPGEIILKIAE